MAIESTMLALGTPAPHFSLLEPATGATVSLDDLAGPALVVTFICNHCPYVKHVAAGLAALGRDLADQGVAMVGISSNDVVTYPQDGPDQMAAAARDHGWTFPYLYDETQDIARAYSAACTPDTFVFDGERRLVYRGPTRQLPPGQRSAGDGCRCPGRGRRRTRRAARRRRPTTVDRMRHQVALSAALMAARKRLRCLLIPAFQEETGARVGGFVDLGW